MKNLLFIIVVIICTTACNLKDEITPNVQSETRKLIHGDIILLRIVFLQDVSLSISSHGIELITSSVFQQLFNRTDIEVELNFGLISSISSKQMVSLFLPAFKSNRPELLGNSIGSITEKRHCKEQYIKALAKYRADSLNYYIDRKERISAFANKMDSIINQYRNALTLSTDIATAFTVADRVFNSSIIDSSMNYLVLNTDGLVPQSQLLPELRNDPEIIWVTADKANNSPLNCVSNIDFQSSEQAINYIIQKTKPHESLQLR